MSAPEDAVSAIRLVVAYDGRAFHGWQRQPGQRTVQGTLLDAIRKLDPRVDEVRGASRTDAGVHAAGQVASFDTWRELPEKGWRMELNKLLPDDLSVRGAFREAIGYDPRFDSLGKLYRYRVHVGVARDPLRDPHSWHLGPALARKDVAERGDDVASYLDLDAMRAAASALEGTHDFHAFRSADDERKNTVRTLHAVRVVTPYAEEPDAMAIEVHGTAFMKNMVRILTGTLVDVGRGRLASDVIGRMLSPEGTRADGGQTAPAHGLCLVRVELGRAALGRSPESA